MKKLVAAMLSFVLLFLWAVAATSTETPIQTRKRRVWRKLQA
jgi:hypothetical protein